MSFINYPYYLFLSLILLVLLFIKLDRRWLFLLAFSVFFYGYGRWEYLLLLFTSISIDYCCGLKIANSSILLKRRLWLILSLTTNLGILFFFKYFPSLYESWTWLEIRTSTLSTQFNNIVLPLGISFYTLQSMGYTIDVFRNKVQAEPHFGYFSLYVCFFPQLVAGPIERPQKLLPQLHNPSPISLKNIESGLFLIGMGLFKKLVIADRLYIILDDFVVDAARLAGWQALVFGTFTVVAIYIDIAAYTAIARGSARLFGIELSRNFKRPLLAHSLGEFWQRWHISVTSWIMDYIYVPLAQLNKSKTHRNFALIITFIIIGFWHGPTIPFVLMGGIQGIIIVLERLFLSSGLRWPQSKFFNMLRLIRTHIVLNLCGILFLSPTIETAVIIYTKLFYFENFWGNATVVYKLHGYYFLCILITGLITLFITHTIRENHTLRLKIAHLPVLLRLPALYILFFITLAFSESTSDEFLYFVF